MASDQQTFDFYKLKLTNSFAGCDKISVNVKKGEDRISFKADEYVKSGKAEPGV